MIMSGAKEATLAQVQMVDIHGTHYYDIVYTHTDDNQTRQARVGKEAIYTDPQPGDTVRVAYLMNVVTNVQRR
ncbi:MAG: hypothetical protein MI924_11950 [Chloroflexales bacterium]|nr:hypothetical protein [Chloroflexales bacterium]